MNSISDWLTRDQHLIKEMYKEFVDELLDDPAWIQGDAHNYVASVIRVGKKLGLDFDGVAKEVGTPFEINRLKELVENTKCSG